MLVNHYPESMTKACEDTYTGVAPIDILKKTDVFGFCETGSLTVDRPYGNESTEPSLLEDTTALLSF